MRIEDQVQKQLEDEHNKFSNAPYSGKGTITSNIIELFSVCYF